jgi:hypothetical protein
MDGKIQAIRANEEMNFSEKFVESLSKIFFDEAL